MHFFKALETKYQDAVDWEGKYYIGLTLDWNYKDHYVGISVPGYITKLLKN